MKFTRRIIDAIHSGELDQGTFRTSDVFGLHVPTCVEGVPEHVMVPEKGWKDAGEYRA